MPVRRSLPALIRKRLKSWLSFQIRSFWQRCKPSLQLLRQSSMLWCYPFFFLLLKLPRCDSHDASPKQAPQNNKQWEEFHNIFFLLEHQPPSDERAIGECNDSNHHTHFVFVWDGKGENGVSFIFFEFHILKVCFGVIRCWRQGQEIALVSASCKTLGFHSLAWHRQKQSCR